MKSALPNKSFLSIVEGQYQSQRFAFAQGIDSFIVSTHLEVGETDLLHYHDEPHLTFILNGGLTDKRKSSDVDRLAGELMFFLAGESHQTIYRTFPSTHLSLQFQPAFFQKNSVTEYILKKLIEQNLNAKFTMLKIYKELALNDKFSDASVEMLLLGLLDGKDKLSSSHPAWLGKVVELLNDNWNRNVSLEDLGVAAGVHPKTISKYFPRYFDCTLGEYRRKLKVEKSLPLIKASKYSLTEIAHECDFFDQSHFTRTFREVTGFLPRQFQKL